MAQEYSAIDYNDIYYAEWPTAELPDSITSSTDWISAGFTRVEEPDGDAGAVLTWVRETKKKRIAGSLMESSEHPIRMGLESLTFASLRCDDKHLTLALPEASHVGEHLTADGNTKYLRVAVVTDNNVYWLKKVANDGKLTQTITNTEFTGTPYTFMCFEDDSAGAKKGAANFRIIPLTS
ncbi:MAG: hypothetical protein JRG73_16480 [Deltaproteobacteria bacterium]|nr:hypothetical protein [Deltaproteobacteria bacterium]